MSLHVAHLIFGGVHKIDEMRRMKFDITNYIIQPHPETKNWVYVWEPLNTTAPETAHPYCCYNSTVIFYEDADKLKEIDRTEYTIRYSFRGNTILQGNGFVLQLMSGKVVWHADRWQMQWLAHKHLGQMVEKESGLGLWVQGDCVFIQAEDGVSAVEQYRSKLCNGEVGVSTSFPSAIAHREANEKLTHAIQLLGLAEDALQEVWDTCSHEHRTKVGEALSRLKASPKLP